MIRRQVATATGIDMADMKGKKYCGVCIENYGELHEVKRKRVPIGTSSYKMGWVCPHCCCHDDYFVGEYLLASLKDIVKNINKVIDLLEKKGA